MSCNQLNINYLNRDGRDACFDVARSLCIIWIVAGLHLTTYIDTSWFSSLGWSLLVKMSYASLGTFSFISGYFLKHKEIFSLSDCYTFYVSRFKRFWVPFLLSALTLWIIGAAVGKPWFSSPLNFALSLFGLSGFFGPMPPTLWFMVMMVLMYWITPALLYNKKTVWLKSLICVGLFCFLYQMDFLDYKIMVYGLMYLLGLASPDSVSNYVRKNKILVILITGVLLATIIVMDNMSGLVLYYLSALLGIPFIISVSELLSSQKMVNQLSSFFSYSSMNMYLFHRQIYLAALFFANYRMFPNFHGAVIPLWFAFIFVIPFIIAFSFFSQKYYDKMIAKFFK